MKKLNIDFIVDVKSFMNVSAALAYPDIAAIGDIDNAIINLTFTSGKTRDIVRPNNVEQR